MRKRIPEAQRQENFGLIGERTIRPRGRTSYIEGDPAPWLSADRDNFGNAWILAVPGKARPGEAWRGAARQGKDSGAAVQGRAGRGWAWLGLAGQGKELGLASQPANTQNTRNTVTTQQH
jgi:hypothetical protein